MHQRNISQNILILFELTVESVAVQVGKPRYRHCPTLEQGSIAFEKGLSFCLGHLRFKPSSDESAGIDNTGR